MSSAPAPAPAASGGGSDVMEGFAEYGRIRATIGKWFAYFFGALMIIGGIVLIAMAAAGTIGTSDGCTPGCCNPSVDGCECSYRCHNNCSDDCEKSCRTCDDTALSRGAYIGMGAGLIVVALIAIVISTIVARLAHESKGFAAVSGGVGAVSDIANVAGMAARGAGGLPMMGVF
jgi:hypothetical protein